MSKRKINADASSTPAKKPKVSSEFELVQASLTLSIPPIFAADPLAGVHEMLDSMVMRSITSPSSAKICTHISPRYIPAFEGVVLSHSNVQFLQPTAVIQADCPFLISDITFDATVWSPRVGMQLTGKVSLCSPDHLSLLIHETFNASIPRSHIQTHSYEFQYTSDEDDDEQEEPESSSGKWVHKLTAEPLERVKFTVIGYVFHSSHPCYTHSPSQFNSRKRNAFPRGLPPRRSLLFPPFYKPTSNRTNNNTKTRR
jgi:DNA-directed RNA polymerase I subunit RPA43